MRGRSGVVRVVLALCAAWCVLGAPVADDSGEELFNEVSPVSGRVVVRDVSKDSQAVEKELTIGTRKFPPLRVRRTKSGLMLTPPAAPEPTAQAMLGALTLHSSFPSSVLVVGAGNGGLATYLAATFPEALVEVVEDDPVVARVANLHFGLNTTRINRLRFLEHATLGALPRQHFYRVALLDSLDCDTVTISLLNEIVGALTDDGVLAVPFTPRCEERVLTNGFFAFVGNASAAVDNNNDNGNGNDTAQPQFAFRHAYQFTIPDSLINKVMVFHRGAGPYKFYTIANRAKLIASKFQLGFDLGGPSVLPLDFNTHDNPNIPHPHCTNATAEA